MGMRRETKAAKGNNRLAVETDIIDDTKHLGGGKIVEELETIETLKTEMALVKRENTHLLSEIADLKLSLLSLGTTKNNEVERLNTKIRELITKPASKEKALTTESTSDEILVYRHKELQSVDAVKLFNAIRSEEKNQDRKDVKLSRKEMVSIYNMNESKVTLIRSSLCQHGFIEVSKEGNGYRFKIRRDLPTR